MSPSQEIHDQWFEFSAQRVIRERGPRYAGGHVHRCVERASAAIGDDDARLLGDQQRGAIVRVTAESFRLTLKGVEERAQVGIEAVVPDDQLVELSAGRDVLVVEDS